MCQSDMSRMTKWDLRILNITDEAIRKFLEINSFDENLDHMHMNWMEKIYKNARNLRRQPTTT